jgi:hypothetical protein
MTRRFGNAAMLGILLITSDLTAAPPRMPNDSETVQFQVDGVEYQFEFGLPDRESILRALPPMKRDRIVQSITCELISTERGVTRNFPRGRGAIRAYSVDSQFRCTVISDQGTEVVDLQYTRFVQAE